MFPPHIRRLTSQLYLLIHLLKSIRTTLSQVMDPLEEVEQDHYRALRLPRHNNDRQGSCPSRPDSARPSRHRSCLTRFFMS